MIDAPHFPIGTRVHVRCRDERGVVRYHLGIDPRYHAVRMDFGGVYAFPGEELTQVHEYDGTDDVIECGTEELTTRKPNVLAMAIAVGLLIALIAAIILGCA